MNFRNFGENRGENRIEKQGPFFIEKRGEDGKPTEFYIEYRQRGPLRLVHFRKTQEEGKLTVYKVRIEVIGHEERGENAAYFPKHWEKYYIELYYKMYYPEEYKKRYPEKIKNKKSETKEKMPESRKKRKMVEQGLFTDEELKDVGR